MIKLFDKEMNEIECKTIDYQWELFPLDNFSAFGLVMDDVYFQTGEHAFQYLKFAESAPEVAEKIRVAFSPNDARMLGQKYKERRISNWSEVKYDYLARVFRLKAEQNPIVKEKLLATKDYYIGECCIDEDTDWGLDKNLEGENNLGKTWMKIRAEMQNPVKPL